jgi:hypothetical protein
MVTPRPDAQLRGLLDDLADAVGHRGRRRWDDEHDRLAVLLPAVHRADLDDVVRAALVVEPDYYVASTVVEEAFHRDPDPAAMAVWVATIPEGRREFVAQRADDHVLYIAVLRGEVEGEPDVTGWSRWVQARIVERIASDVSDGVLTALARDGLTRKVRNVATETLRVRAARARREGRAPGGQARDDTSPGG